MIMYFDRHTRNSRKKDASIRTGNIDTLYRPDIKIGTLPGIEGDVRLRG
jgi:hypothetical protein